VSQVPQIGELEQRIMVFSRAFQDLIETIMKEKQQVQRLNQELTELRKELATLKNELEAKKK